MADTANERSMTTFQRLKHEARRAEQRSDWRKAIALYREAMRFDERQHGSAELGLFNRIGDLHIRLGEIPQAVECYEQAADRYAENELPTSAVALCNKILRVAPERTDVFRRLGLLHAATGLLAEAKISTLQYVDRMEKAESLGEAIEAVQEFVNLTEDETIRVQVADLLAERGHQDQAEAQLRLASATNRRTGRDTGELEQRIDQLSASEPTPVLADVPEPESSPVGSDEPEQAIEQRIDPESVAAVVLGERVNVALARLDPGGVSLEVGGLADSSEEAGLADAPENPVATALQRFRARVQPELDREGPELHYDLGIAFQAMGLGLAAVEELRRGVAAPGRLRAAHRRISDILEPEVEPESVLEVEPEVVPEVEPEKDPTPLDPAPPAFEPEEVPTEREFADAEDADSPAPDLQSLLFRARLAQYQIRQAQDTAGTTDHRSHLDLGAAYSAMGLRQEAIRELFVAADGPGPVVARAIAMLLDISRDPDTDWELAISVAERVRELDQAGHLEPVLHELVGRWGEDHPGAGRLGKLLGWVMTAASPPDEVGPTAGPESEPKPVSAFAEPVLPAGVEVVEQLLDQPEEDSIGTVVPRSDDRSDPVRALEAAERMVVEGRGKEAVSQLYRAMEMFEDAREIREAIAVVDRLLELRPDDVVLHHQRAEFALTLDDRELALSSYMSLGACLRRQNAPGNARTVYTRILDIDPKHGEAREAIAQLAVSPGAASAGETAAIDGNTIPRSATSPESDPDQGPVRVVEGRAEFDALLGELGEPEPNENSFEGDAEAHFELGVAFKQMAMWDEALAELEKAVSGLEDPVRVWEVMGECLERAGRSDEALEILKTAEAHPGSQESPSLGVLYRLALLMEERGDHAGAVLRLGKVVDADSSFRDAASRLSALSR